MIKWICFISIFFCYYSLDHAVMAYDLEIQLQTDNKIESIWNSSVIRITVLTDDINEWSLNGTAIAVFDEDINNYTYPNSIPFINISAGNLGSNSFLLLNGVGRAYSGIYRITGVRDYRELEMTVHEVMLTAGKLIHINQSNVCKVYLDLQDVINPENFQVNRQIQSPTLTFTSNIQLNDSLFEIINGSLPDFNNSNDTQINVKYSFIVGINHSTNRTTNVYRDTFIYPPTYTVRYQSNNCSISINHNTNISCVRNITYRLIINGSEWLDNSTQRLQAIDLYYPENSTNVSFSIIYDLIYTKESFYLALPDCRAEETTTVEPTSTAPSITTSGDQTTTNGNTDEPGSSSSARLTSFSSSSNFTTATISLETNTANVSSSTYTSTINGTGPDNPSGPLAGWAIALIVIGSVLALAIIVGIIAYLIWRKQSKNDSRNGIFPNNKIDPKAPEIPMKPRVSSDSPAARKVIPPPIGAQREERLPPLTDRDQRRRDRRHPTDYRRNPDSSSDTPDRPPRSRDFQDGQPRPGEEYPDFTNNAQSRREVRRNRRLRNNNYSDQSDDDGDRRPGRTAPFEMNTSQNKDRRPLPPISREKY